jgi:phospholipid/cholesterol/gamma-HCH transport system ATP-binding protein
MDTPTKQNGAAETTEDRSRCVLELDDVRVSLDRGMSLAATSLLLERGSLELLDAGDYARAAAFADLCSGLIEPAAGTVRFLGHEWQAMPNDYANAMRGRIGRTFASEGWLPRLSLLDNILLQQRHHTRRAESEILAETSDLARAFGLPGIPVSRPEDVAPIDRVRASLVRAFVGSPALVLLEHPLQGRFVELLEPLVNVVGRARRGGAAVLWLTLTPGTWAMRNLPISGRLRLSEARLARVST